MSSGWLTPPHAKRQRTNNNNKQNKNNYTPEVEPKALGQMLGILLLQLGLTAQWASHMTHIFMKDPSLW